MRTAIWTIPFLLAAAACDDATVATADMALELTTDTLYVAGGDPIDTAGHFFGKVSAMGFDGMGRLHVLDPDRYEVTTWDQHGRIVSRFGSRGEGPHEFSVPRYAYVLEDGSVMVIDIGHSSMLLFASGGSYERSVRLVTSGAVPGKRAVLAGDRIIGEDDYWMMREGADSRALFAYTIGDDSVTAEPYYQAYRPPADMAGLALLPQVRIAPLPCGRIAIADDSEYLVRIISPMGSAEADIRRPVQPLPVTESAMAAERERRMGETTVRDLERGLREMRAVTGIAVSSVNMEQVLAQSHARLADLQFADEVPVIHSLNTDWDDRLWITRSSPTGASGPIDLMYDDGRYEGTITGARTPDAFGPDGLVAYVNTHELGTQSVVVVRITSIAPATDPTTTR